MRSALTLVLLIGAHAAAEPVKLVVPNFKVFGLAPEKSEFYTEHLSGRLSEVGARVTTQRAVSEMLGAERQRQLLGCGADSSSCMGELASALGSDALVLGDIAQVGTDLQLNLKVIAGSSARVVGTHQARVKDEAALLDELDKAAFDLMADASVALHRDPPTPLKRNGPSLQQMSFVPAGVGLAAGIVGAVLFGLSHANYLQIPQNPGDTPRRASEVDAVAQEGKAFRTAGWVCAGVGAAGVVTGAVLFIVGARPSAATPSVTVLPAATGATLLLSGSF